MYRYVKSSSAALLELIDEFYEPEEGVMWDVYRYGGYNLSVTQKPVGSKNTYMYTVDYNPDHLPTEQVPNENIVEVDWIGYRTYDEALTAAERCADKDRNRKNKLSELEDFEESSNYYEGY